MEIRGPCLVTVHNGKECRLYEVCTSEQSLSGYQNVRYFFDNEDDASVYRQYLNQTVGVKNIKRILASKKYPAWEKREYSDYLSTLDLNTLTNLVKDIHFTKESNFVKHKAGKNGNTD